MTFYGFVYPATQITVTSAGITVPFYQMRIYVGIIAIDVDCWGCGGSQPLWTTSNSNPSSFLVTFSDPQGTETVATNPLVYRVKSATRNQLCYQNKYR
jgi:hypothetical protein